MTGTSIQRDIPYAPASGGSRAGDLFVPEGKMTGSPVLLIHGGGWKGLAKEDMEFLVPFFLEAGRAVYNINYRLLGEACWPACGDDCVRAGRFVLEGGLEPHGLSAPDRILVCGASAGGHLAMVTGQLLPRQSVEGILSLAGPSRIDWVAETRDPLGMYVDFLAQFFGRPVLPDDPEVREASPALRGEKMLPPLHCLHSRNDRLVPHVQSEEAGRAWEAGGGEARLTLFDGDGELHGFWIEDDRSRLRPEVGAFVRNTLFLLP